MDIILFSSALIPIVVGVVEAIKRASGIEERWAPLLAIGAGIGLTVLGGAANLIAPPILAAGAVWYGLISGLSASGLYSSAKAMAGR